MAAILSRPQWVNTLSFRNVMNNEKTLFNVAIFVKEILMSLKEIVWISRHNSQPASLGSEDTGPRLNIKTVLSTYGDFHVKDKTAARTSYL